MDSQTLDTAKIIGALAPGFVAGFTVQQAIEVVDTLLSAMSKKWQNLANNPGLKKLIAMTIGIILSIILVLGGQLDVITPLLAAGASVPAFISKLMTVIFISGGTEGFNSLMKWLTWKKEQTKAQAANKPSKAAVAASGA